jgi:hypothetical protein
MKVLTQLNTTTNNSRTEINEQLKLLREESKTIGKKSNEKHQKK